MYISPVKSFEPQDLLPFNTKQHKRQTVEYYHFSETEANNCLLCYLVVQHDALFTGKFRRVPLDEVANMHGHLCYESVFMLSLK